MTAVYGCGGVACISPLTLCTSELTRLEISRSDQAIAYRRLEFLGDCRILTDIPQAPALASRLIETKAVPATEPEDAAHFVIATLSEVKYIVS